MIGSIKWKEMSGLLVGALLMGVLVLFLAVLYNKLFSEGLIGVDEYCLYSDFESGQGLHKGTKVQINGVEVGKVSALKLTAQGKVRLEFTLRSEYAKWITDSSSAYATRDQNVISERVVNIDITKKGRALAAGGVIAAGTAQDIETVLRTANELIDRMGKLVVVADTLLKMAVDTHSTVGALLGSRRLYDKLESQLDQVGDLTSSLGGISGQTGQILTLANDRLPRVLDQVDTALQGAHKLEKDVGALAVQAGGLMGALDTTVAKASVMVDGLNAMSGSIQNLLSTGGETLQNADDLMGGVSKFWLLRSKIPQKDTVPLLVEEPW